MNCHSFYLSCSSTNFANSSLVIFQEYKEIPTSDIKVGKIDEKDEMLLQKVWAKRKH